jgi:hypothetical protein
MNPQDLLNFMLLGAAILFLLAAAATVYALALAFSLYTHWARHQRPPEVARDHDGRPIKERI